MEIMKPTGQRILVVDDDSSLSLIVGEALRLEGYHPIIRTNPRDALAVSEEESFGLAFIDLNMPEINGLDLALKLKQQNPVLEVVFITGYGTLDNAVEAIKIGAYDYLKKPFSIDDLNLCLKRYQERQQLKEQVKLAEKRYSNLVQNLPLLIYVIRKDYQLEFINQACTAMLGFTPEEAKNTPNWLLERIHPEDRTRIKNSLDNAFNSGGSPFSVECRLIHKQGHLIHSIFKSITSSPHTAGHVGEHLEGLIVDITDRIFLEKALVQREKLKTLGAISAEVSHEIRNPLVSIGGFARRLQRKFPGLSECDIILRETQRLEKMLDRIRNYLKP
ncbi:MAG: response regulator, partial [Deltaproteobacteria bacterium]